MLTSSGSCGPEEDAQATGRGVTCFPLRLRTPAQKTTATTPMLSTAGSHRGMIGDLGASQCRQDRTPSAGAPQSPHLEAGMTPGPIDRIAPELKPAAEDLRPPRVDAAISRRAEGSRPGRYLSVSAATPGSTLPSRNSSDAPPPVETCDTLLATPAFFTADAESPPPMMVVAPAAVALASASATAIVPLAVASISNTPTGPFQTIVLAPRRIFSNAAVVSGPMSTHSQSPGMVVLVTTFVAPTVRPLKSNLSVATKSVPRTSLSPASLSRLFARSILSFSTIDFPVSRPCAFRKV